MPQLHAAAQTRSRSYNYLKPQAASKHHKTVDDAALKKYAGRGWAVGYGISRAELAAAEAGGGRPRGGAGSLRAGSALRRRRGVLDAGPSTPADGGRRRAGVGRERRGERLGRCGTPNSCVRGFRTISWTWRVSFITINQTK
ncbi:hypothetical protein BJ912DRAFT_1057192 [Pholiota molesta]|nr:hypothetical protein BJ912DRAFT_1057192 [Pholiota molesta]